MPRTLLPFLIARVAAASVWPQPTTFTNGSTQIHVIQNPAFFQLVGAAAENDVLRAAVARFYDLTFP
eukprot:CAMPEP_0119291670 /NCGR_PEP_ID=MMETSP1329-20130426/42819_1 /TAXON_ID=114041 /ORGANISM="Genus nov. species nov., Strain RCC1024" /LENGTH=66 /DNA_ID=CAMNT_0007292495 /DNA_START=29 /DNA_END=226 /DNA_ORIENTATION=+